MSETKFTPGNWTIEDVTTRGEGWAIASDHDFPTSTGKTYRKYVAQFASAGDASLIAAAPDLYAALVEARWLLRAICGTDGNYPDEKKIIAAATAALAKARGETP